MSLTNRGWVMLTFAVGTALAVGCGQKEDKSDLPENDLQRVHDLYFRYLKNHEQKPPAKLSDLTSPTYEPLFPAAVEALKKGKYVAVYGITDKDGGTVLAYEKDAATGGGRVLMADGTIKTMTADEFKATKH
jgi:hypothetical protein